VHAVRSRLLLLLQRPSPVTCDAGAAEPCLAASGFSGTELSATAAELWPGKGGGGTPVEGLAAGAGSLEGAAPPAAGRLNDR